MRRALCGSPFSGAVLRFCVRIGCGDSKLRQETFKELDVGHFAPALDASAPSAQVGGGKPVFSRRRKGLEGGFKARDGVALEEAADQHQLIELEMLKLNRVGKLVA